MADFTQDIQNFRRYGTYDCKFDKSGNLTFNSSSTDFSQHYIMFPLKNVIFNNVKANSFYNPEFEEFIPNAGSLISIEPNSEDLQQQLSIIQQENLTLKNQLDIVIAQNEASGSDASQLAVKSVILELRKALGQGRIDSDFSDEFPYTSIRNSTI